MTPEERITALKNLGYSREEAHFLAIAALHSGYFLRRQFLSFVNGTKGGKDVALLNKLKINKHCRMTAYRHNRMVYHLSAKPLYEALGEKDNRNRREHQPSTIKRKLMGLDFVLDHPTYPYLATEREKLDYFTGTLQIAPEALPTRWYESPRGGGATAKHFVDKYPLFLEPSAGCEPVVHFCYVDEGAQGVDGLATHLDQYGRLLAALPDFRIIYIAHQSGLFEAARRIFDRFSARLGRQTIALDPAIRRLLDYFEARKAYEARDFNSFDTARLIRYREEKKEFTAERYEALYAVWKAGGNAAVLSQVEPPKVWKEAPVDRFSTYVVEHDYDLFGNLTNAPQTTEESVATQTQG